MNDDFDNAMTDKEMAERLTGEPYTCVECEKPVPEDDAVWVEDEAYHVACAPPQHADVPGCGCRVTEPDEYVDARDADATSKFGISFCPLHAAAPDLLDLAYTVAAGNTEYDDLERMAEAIIARVVKP